MGKHAALVGNKPAGALNKIHDVELNHLGDQYVSFVHLLPDMVGFVRIVTPQKVDAAGDLSTIGYGAANLVNVICVIVQRDDALPPKHSGVCGVYKDQLATI